MENVPGPIGIVERPNAEAMQDVSAGRWEKDSVIQVTADQKGQEMSVCQTNGVTSHHGVVGVRLPDYVQFNQPRFRNRHQVDQAVAQTVRLVEVDSMEVNTTVAMKQEKGLKEAKNFLIHIMKMKEIRKLIARKKPE